MSIQLTAKGLVAAVFISAAVMGANAKPAPADVSVPPLVIQSVPTPEPTPPIVRGVVTCLTAAPDKIAAVNATMGPMSPAEIYKGVGCD